jgi:hypothetical protein
MKRLFTIFVLFSILFSACGWLPVSAQAESSVADSGGAVLLFGIGMHIEPQGTTLQGIRSGKGNYADPVYFEHGVKDIRAVAGIISAHAGRMTVQTQSPFTDSVLANHSTILSDLALAGNEIGLHFHEDAHLGRNSTALSIDRWCEVMKTEIALIQKASGVTRVSYWSGGNLYPHVLEAAQCASLSVNSDWKNPQTQTTNSALIGIHPWRPAGGTEGTYLSEFAEHDSTGEVVFLPEGLYDRNDFASMRRSEQSGGDKAYFEYLKKSLLASVAAAGSGQVNVFHFTLHPGEFRGSQDHPYAVIEQFLKEVVDPLVAEGKIQWATFSEMADAYTAWEQTHPGQDMR